MKDKIIDIINSLILLDYREYRYVPSCEFLSNIGINIHIYKDKLFINSDHNNNYILNKLFISLLYKKGEQA